jgi:transposase
MTEAPLKLVSDETTPESPRLPGHIFFESKESGTYGKYAKTTYVKEGKVYHETVHLGRVIDKDLGLFRSRSRGYFTFNLQDGYGQPPENLNLQRYDCPSVRSLDFGDAWMVDQVFKKTGLESILNNLVPGSEDTLKALVSYRLLEQDAFCYAEDWYKNSYARLIYPNANLASPRISEFLSIIGLDQNNENFFRSYLRLISKNENISDQISIPILLDSTVLPNDIKTYLTAINKHNDVISNEIRLIYVIDQRTKLTIFYRFIAGNIIDNSSLINTINILLTYNIKIELVVMDAGYSALKNLIELTSTNISFLTRMPHNWKEFKKLINEHGNDLLSEANAIIYGERALFCKKIKIKLFDSDIYAYVMHDINRAADDIIKLIKNSENNNNDDKANNNENEIFKDKLNFAGKFILLSSNDYPEKEILPLYYTRQGIEDVFSISKTYASLLPLRSHSIETIKGTLLINFISTIVYSTISHGLSETSLSAKTAIIKMHHLKINVFESAQILEELTKDQKIIINDLQLETPYDAEKGLKLKKESLLSSLKSVKRKKGRPKGSKKYDNPDLPSSPSNAHCPNPDEKRARGRPKGSRNKVKSDLAASTKANPDPKRARGRPRGSRNKVKPDLAASTKANPDLKRARGDRGAAETR